MLPGYQWPIAGEFDILPYKNLKYNFWFAFSFTTLSLTCSSRNCGDKNCVNLCIVIHKCFMLLTTLFCRIQIYLVLPVFRLSNSFPKSKFPKFGIIFLGENSPFFYFFNMRRITVALNSLLGQHILQFGRNKPTTNFSVVILLILQFVSSLLHIRQQQITSCLLLTTKITMKVLLTFNINA